MWFLLRAVFWLSIVYASIFSPKDPAASAQALAWIAREAKATFGRSAGLAEEGAEKACRRMPGACLEGAARLGKMIAADPPKAKGKALPRPTVVDSPAAGD
jgi:hypothetical protein